MATDLHPRTRAVLVDAPGAHRIVPMEPAEPGAGDAVIRVVAAGMCGSDREIVAGTRLAPFVRYPVIPGHEWSGVVEAVGPGVSQDLVGQPVVGEGFRACFACERCRSGATNLCQAGYDETGFTQPGAFADYLVLPARLLHVLADADDLAVAPLLEPAACAADAVAGTGIQPGERAAVVGTGTLGLLSIALLASYSPAEVVAIDPRRGQEELARRLGATAFVTPAEPGGGADGADVGEFDVVVEAAGVSTSARFAAELARRGGRVALIGIPGDGSATLPVGLLVGRQLTLTTVFGASSAGWLAAVRAFNSGLLDLAPLVTHELPLEEFGTAIELLSSGRPDVGKILLRP